MKLTDKIVQKFGADKVLHFMGGALITALFAIFGYTGALIGLVATVVLSFVKEAVFDAKFDRKDIAAGVLGGVASFAISVLFIFLSTLL